MKWFLRRRVDRITICQWLDEPKSYSNQKNSIVFARHDPSGVKRQSRLTEKVERVDRRSCTKFAYMAFNYFVLARSLPWNPGTVSGKLISKEIWFPVVSLIFF